MNPDKALQGGSSIEAGNYLVFGAKFQNMKTDFRPNQTYLVFDTQVLDADGDVVRGADNIEIPFSFGEKSLELFHPGKADSPGDEPEDMGAGVDAEGNTIYCVEEGAQFNKSCGMMVLMESLTKSGFPKAVMDKSWAEDYVGLKFTLATRTGKECNEKFGTRLSTKPAKDGGTVTYKVADKWLNPNYLSGGDAKPKGGKANGKATDEPALTGEDLAMHVLGEVAKLKAGEKNAIKSKNALVGFFTNVFTKGKYKGLPEAQKLIKDDDWLAGAVATLGGTYEDGVTTFPAE